MTASRRWSFRLRTLLLGVAILAVPLAWIGWQAHIVHERTSLRRSLEARGRSVIPLSMMLDSAVVVPQLNLIRRMMGDEEIIIVVVGEGDADRSRAEALFPEAVFARHDF